jgi:hypothetical protein
MTSTAKFDAAAHNQGRSPYYACSAMALEKSKSF